MSEPAEAEKELGAATAEKEPEAADRQPAAAEPEQAVPDGETFNLNSATFEQLREAGFSVTQATRVITYRERQGGFDSLDDLDAVPGMPRPFLRNVKRRLTL